MCNDDGWTTVVRKNFSQIITPTLQLNIDYFAQSVDDHVPSKTTANIPTIPIAQEAPPAPERQYSISEVSLNRLEKQDRKLKRRQHRRETLDQLARQEDHFLDDCITVAEDERTVTAKADTTNGKKLIINKAHDKSNAKPTPGIKQHWRNTSYDVCSAFKRTAT